MNLNQTRTNRTFARAARGLLAAAIAVGATAGLAATPASAGTGDLCSPGPTPTITVYNGTPVAIYEHEKSAVKVRLSNPSCNIVSVKYQYLSFEAEANIDFFAASGTLSFAPGQVERTLWVTPINDSVQEGKERVYVQISAPSGGTLANTAGIVVIDGVEPQ